MKISILDRIRIPLIPALVGFAFGLLLLALPHDSIPPTVTILSPLSGAVVNGTITVTALASDDIGVVGVQFKLDGFKISAEDHEAPWSFNWNTTATSNGAHTLSAVASDKAGNQTTSRSVRVTVGVSEKKLCSPKRARIQET